MPKRKGTQQQKQPLTLDAINKIIDEADAQREKDIEEIITIMFPEFAVIGMTHTKTKRPAK